MEENVMDRKNVERKVSVVEDLNGNKIVVIHDIRFKGRQAIAWSDVEEYAHSNYTNTLKGANAKAKANAAQGIPQIIKIATNKAHKDNFKQKHNRDAKYGWYRYESRVALPVYKENGEIERYNVFGVIMVVRHAEDHKMYLYDIMNIKKETSTHFQS